MAENAPYTCLVGTAVYMHGNSAETFVEQAKLSGMTTMFISYLEDKKLAKIVPRMEPHYLNPSPWAEKEAYEIEFNNVMKEVKCTFLIYQVLFLLVHATYQFFSQITLSNLRIYIFFLNYLMNLFFLFLLQIYNAILCGLLTLFRIFHYIYSVLSHLRIFVANFVPNYNYCIEKMTKILT